MATFADKPTITGERVVLRPLVEADADALYASVQDPEGRHFTGTHRVFTPEEIRRWCASRAEQDDRLDLAIVERATGAWAGELAVLDWDADNRSCGFRIALDAGSRDRGLGREATELVVDYVFEHLPVHRLSLEVYDFNERARAVYERVGFVAEGVLRESLHQDGAFHGTIVMSILRPEWEARRAQGPGGRVQDQG